MENQKLYKKYTHLIKTLNPANVTNVCEAKGAECDSFRHIYLHDKTVVENYLCKIIDTKDNGQRINKNSTVPVKESLVDLKNRSKKKKKNQGQYFLAPLFGSVSHFVVNPDSVGMIPFCFLRRRPGEVGSSDSCQH